MQERGWGVGTEEGTVPAREPVQQGFFVPSTPPGESAAHPTYTTEAQSPPPLLLPSHPTTPWACANMGTQGRGASGPEEEEEERTNSLISLPLISGEPCSPGTATRKGLEAYGRLRVPPWDSVRLKPPAGTLWGQRFGGPTPTRNHLAPEGAGVLLPRLPVGQALWEG